MKPKIFFRNIIYILFCLFISNNLSAQCNAAGGFIQGTFLEIGVSNCGSIGTSGVIPPGYNNNFPTGVSTVSDAGRDGWTTGNPPFCGDFFLPGSPVEGWGVQFDGTSYFNSNENFNCQLNDIAATTACSFPTTLQHQWSGLVNGMAITQTTQLLNPTDLFYTIEVSLTNTTGTAMNNVFYARNADPDNELIHGGGFETINTIDANTRCRHIVSAVGLDFRCYAALVSSDNRSTVSYGGFFMDPVVSNYANGIPPHITTVGSTANVDESISIGFNLGNIAAGATVNFAFAYVFDFNEIQNALDATDPDRGPCVITADGTDISDNPTTTIACGDQVDLTITQPNFTWTWSPTPTTIVNPDGSHVIVNPTTTTTYTVTGTGRCGNVVKHITVVVEKCCKIKPDFNYTAIGSCGFQFIDLTTSGAGTSIVGYHWDFGDGNTSTLQNPVHFYTNPGVYSVTLTIIGVGINGKCCTEKITKTVGSECEKPPCYVAAGFDINYLGGPTFMFSNTSVSNSVTTIVGYYWEVNGTFVSDSEDLIHIFSPSSHKVCLTVYGLNEKGECCESKICKKICLKRLGSGWKNCTEKDPPSEGSDDHK